MRAPAVVMSDRTGVEVFTLVDTSTWYVIANFRETQLRHILPDAPPVPAVAARPPLPWDRRRARVGGASGERDQRHGATARRALARLDPARRVLPGTHQGGGSGQHLPAGGLGHRDGSRHPPGPEVITS